MSKMFGNKTKFVILFVSSHHILSMKGFIVFLSPSKQIPGLYLEIGHKSPSKILIRRLLRPFILFDTPMA
jgi:hypothetical protein